VVEQPIRDRNLTQREQTEPTYSHKTVNRLCWPCFAV